jgi:GT2 family glycosyltransferase
MNWIEKCIRSVLDSSCTVHIIVVDNGSKDGTTDHIEVNFPGVHLIRSEKNLGFGQANNIGIAKAIKEGAAYLFLLNQDAWVEPSTIQSLLQTGIAFPGYGVISPLHFNGSGTALDRFFEQYLRNAGISGTVAELQSDSRLIPVEFVNAAAWLISRDCIEACGGFDPIFFHYGEDINYTQRSLFHGFRIGVFTGARIWHDREQRTASIASDARTRLKREWIHFLNQACDIRNRSYRMLVLKRFLRHLLFSMASAFRLSKNEFVFHSGMARRIFVNSNSIAKSRQRNTVRSKVNIL